MRRLRIFLVDLANLSVLVKNHFEGFAATHDDFSKLFFLEKHDGLQFHHFEHGKKGDDHGVTRRASLEKLDEADAARVARQNPRAELRDHLGHGELLVLKLDSRHFLAALDHLLEYLDQVHQRNDQVAL